MADKRLEDIRTSDDAESTINVELIEWLKTTGVNFLLVILVAVILFRGWLWWGERQDRIRDEAWADLAGTDSPASLEALADRAAGIDSVPQLALLRAADLYQLDILRDQTLDLVPENDSLVDPNADPSKETEDETKSTPRMTEQERTQTLDRMERIYQRVFDSTQSEGGGTNWRELLKIRAMFGLAAVAEMRGDFEKAGEWFTRIESAASPRYEKLAQLALAWKDDPSARTRVEFPEESVVNAALREPPAAAPDNDAGGGKAAAEGDAKTEPKDDAAPADEPAEKPTDQPAEEEPAPGDGG